MLARAAAKFPETITRWPDFISLGLNGYFQIFQDVWLQILLGYFSQVFGRNYLVCIDVAPVEKENRSAECFHCSTP
jgi:hypothetical protein